MEKSKRRTALNLAVVLSIFALLLTGCAPSATAEPTALPTLPAATLPASDLSSSSATDTVATPAPTPTLFVLTGAKTTSTGLQYLEETAGTGETPKPGDIIRMHYVASLADGTELMNTYTVNQPAVTVFGVNRMLPGWEEGVGLMKAGGKAQLVLPAELAFGAEGSGSIPPNAQLLLEVELLTVEVPPLPTEVAADKMTKTESGLQYYDLSKGEGAEAVKSSTVSTAYTVWVKTETGYSYVEKSEAGMPLSFVLGRGDTVFPGWEEGATGMKVGGKRLLVVPPELGLGAQPNDIIPANSTLVLEIELTDVKEPRVATKVDEKDYKSTESGLKYYDIEPGTGESPKAGQTVAVHYTGWLTDGTQFDSSVDYGQPFSFTVGAGEVIKGWDEGLLTMKVGGKRQLVIPSDLAYGDQGAGTVIPPGATLIFEIELLEIQ